MWEMSMCDKGIQNRTKSIKKNKKLAQKIENQPKKVIKLIDLIQVSVESLKFNQTKSKPNICIIKT